MRIALAMGPALLGCLLLASPAAFADPARDNILRAEAQLAALNPADAATAAAPDYQSARLRLDEARSADDRNRPEESLRRSQEALLLADLVQEKIKLRGLERTVSEIETGISALRRELTS